MIHSPWMVEEWELLSKMAAESWVGDKTGRISVVLDPSPASTEHQRGDGLGLLLKMP